MNYIKPELSLADLFYAVKLQTTGGSSEGQSCASDLPTNAVADEGCGDIVNESNVLSCDFSNATMRMESSCQDESNPPQLVISICIIPDGTTAPDMEIVIGSNASGFEASTGFNVNVLTASSEVAVNIYGTNTVIDGSTLQIDLDNMQSGDTDLDGEVTTVILTLENVVVGGTGSSLVDVDCVQGI